MLEKGILHHAEKGARTRGKAQFPLALARRRSAAGLAKLNVAARKVGGLAALRLAKQYLPVDHANSPRDGFDSG